MKLTEQQVEFLTNNSELPIDELMKQTGLSAKKVNAFLAELKKAELEKFDIQGPEAAPVVSMTEEASVAADKASEQERRRPRDYVHHIDSKPAR